MLVQSLLRKPQAQQMQQERLEALDDCLAEQLIALLVAPAPGPLSQIRAIRRQGLLGYDGVRFFDGSFAHATDYPSEPLPALSGVRL